MQKAASEFAKILLENAKKIWRKGAYYRSFKEIDADAQRRVDSIERYVEGISDGINKIFKTEEEIIDLCNSVLFDVISQ